MSNPPEKRSESLKLECEKSPSRASVKRVGDAKRDRVYSATVLVDILKEPARPKPAVNK